MSVESRVGQSTRRDRCHPAGALGRQLTLQVADLMLVGEAVPRIAADTPMRDALLEMTSKRLGITGVFDAAGALVGAITDGDLRRALESDGDLLQRSCRAVMTPSPKTVSGSSLAVDALRLMEQFAITTLFVVDGEATGQVVGIIHIHDLVKAGLR